MKSGKVSASKVPEIRGFLEKPKRTARNAPYGGRYSAKDVQWTGQGGEALVTFTITAEELADVAENQLLWTDQDVQRGIRPGLTPLPPRELSVGAGYPDPRSYIFDAENADDMVEKLLRGDKLFLSPLIWNLRPGTFEAHWDSDRDDIYLYTGKIFLPDSHHRQQAILKAVRAYREARNDYPKFAADRQFTMELYFLSKEDEGNYFFDKNQRPKPTSKSKAYDLTTLDDLSLLAKKVVDLSEALDNNVNRVTDRLTAKNPQVITLSTLREMMRTLAPSEALDEPELDGLATVAATFYDLIANIRPELGRLDSKARREVRKQLIVDSAVMMHGYAALMSAFNDALANLGTKKAMQDWRQRLDRLSSLHEYTLGRWRGDLFEKRNPLWGRLGVVKPGKKRLTVLNTGAARLACGKALVELVTAPRQLRNLSSLVR